MRSGALQPPDPLRPAGGEERGPISPRPPAAAGETNRGDRLFRWATALVAASGVALLLLLGGALAVASRESLAKFGLGFLVSSSWNPVREVFGAAPFLYGTLVSSLLALLLAAPVGVGVAIYLAELAPPWIGGPLGLLVELLAAVPSVVYGLWGLLVVAPWLGRSVEPSLARALGFLPLFRGPSQGVGMLAAGILLAIMILPTLASVGREVLRAVPAHLREGSLALGANRWETIGGVVLPVARSGLVGALVLALGRALGETMAVAMVIGNRPQISASLFAPASTLASALANEFTEATGDLYLSSLGALGLVLFALTLLLNLLARLLVRGGGGASIGEAEE